MRKKEKQSSVMTVLFYRELAPVFLRAFLLHKNVDKIIEKNLFLKSKFEKIKKFICLVGYKFN
jgi:hypothetical protein